MTLDELKTRHRELLARKREELALQDKGEGDNMALFMVEEELLEVNAQIRALTPGKRIGTKGGHLRGDDYTYGRKQLKDWLETQNEPDEDVLDTRTIMKETLAEARSLMTKRQWEMFELWTTGMNATRIGEKLNVETSTATRTLKRAKTRLQDAVSIRGIAEGHMEEITLDMSETSVCKVVLSCITITQVVYLYLYFGEYLSCIEIAKLLNCNVSTVSRAIHRGLDGISHSLNVPHIQLENMNTLGEVAYQFYVSTNKLDDPPPKPEHHYWGRATLRNKFHEPIPEIPPEIQLNEADEEPDEGTEEEHGPETPVVSYRYEEPLPRREATRRSFGKLLTALLARKRRYQSEPRRAGTLILHWLKQIFHGMVVRLRKNT